MTLPTRFAGWVFLEMGMSLKLHTAPNPATLAVSLAEARAHLRLNSNDTSEDAKITSLILAATEDAEHVMRRAILPQKWQLTLDAFDRMEPLWLRRPKVTAVDWVKYIDQQGTLQTLDPAQYRVVLDDYACTVFPVSVWPRTGVHPESVQVVFSTGWATPADVPHNIKAWILLYVGTFFANRELEAQVAQPFYRLGQADRLLDRYRSF